MTPKKDFIQDSDNYLETVYYFQPLNVFQSISKHFQIMKVFSRVVKKSS